MKKKIYWTNAECPRCKRDLLLSPVEDYVFYCEHCDEDFYGFETRQIWGDWFEITINMKEEEFNTILKSIKENFKDACFIGHDNYNTISNDDNFHVCDIGFSEIPSGERVKDIINFFNLMEK